MIQPVGLLPDAALAGLIVLLGFGPLGGGLRLGFAAPLPLHLLGGGEAGLAPGLQDFVGVGPVHLALAENGALVGQVDHLIGEAPLDPTGDVLPLPVDGGPFLGDAHGGEHPPLPLVDALLLAQVFLRPLHGGDAQPFPPEGLLLHLGHPGRGGVRPTLAAAHAHHIPCQHEDDLHGQGQVVVDGVQALQVRVREHLAQQPLHLPVQAAEAVLLFQGVGNVPPGVLRWAVVPEGRRGGGRGGGGAAHSQPQADQPGKGGVEAGGVPAQGLGCLVRAAPALEQRQIQQRAVPVPRLHQPPGGLGGHGQHLIGQQQHGHSRTPPLFFSCTVYFTGNLHS